MQFTAYNDRSSAKRGFARKFKEIADLADRFLEKVDGKWGFYPDNVEEDAPQLQKAAMESAAAIEEGGAQEARAIQDARLHEVLVGTYRSLGVLDPEATATAAEASMKSAVINDPHGALAADLEDEAPAPVKVIWPGSEARASDPALAAAIEKGMEESSDENTGNASAFGAFAFAQLTAPRAPETSFNNAAKPLVIAKIEKNRPENNGVKRPSAGTTCARVWDTAASMSVLSESGAQPHTKVATLSEVIKACEAKGINKFTARTQYARWRVFNGITGRIG